LDSYAERNAHSRVTTRNHQVTVRVSLRWPTVRVSLRPLARAMGGASVQLVRLGCTVACAIVLVPAAVAGCTSLFGLNEPTLACESGGECPDASVPRSLLPALDGSPGGEGGSRTDASLDGDGGDGGDDGNDAGDGSIDGDASADTEAGPAAVRCGLADASPPYCTIGTVCCAELAADGTLSFSCKASCAAPAGFPINCADSRDCVEPLDCCHASDGMFCRSSCSEGATLTCDPVARPCSASRKCNVSLSILGKSSTAYLGCN
jgi:hypothetical protein